MHLESTGRCHDNSRIRRQTAHATLNVGKLFQAHVGTEATFSEDITLALGTITFVRSGEFECDTIGKDG